MAEEVTRREFLVSVGGVAVGTLVLPVPSEEGTAGATGETMPERRLVLPPSKQEMDDGFLLVWSEETSEGVTSMMWHAQTEEEQADAQLFYEKTHGYDDLDESDAEEGLFSRVLRWCSALFSGGAESRSPEERRLISAIIAHPDSVESRLAYADWLSDRGDPQGEFIRLSHEVEKYDERDERRKPLDERWSELYESIGPKLVAPLKKLGLRPQVMGIPFPGLFLDDGLVAKVWIEKPGVLPERAGRLFAAAPLLMQIRLNYESVDAAGLAEVRQLEQVRSLGLSSCGVGPDGFRRLLESPHVSRLRELDVSYNPLGPEAGEVLARSPVTRRLRSLKLDACELGSEGVRRLAEARAPNLEEIGLSDNAYDTPSLIDFFNAEGFPGLRRLALRRQALGTDGAEALARSSLAGRLAQLDLAWVDLSADGVKALLAGSWPHLKSLNLTSNGLDADCVQAIFRSTAFPKLQELELSFNDLTGTAANAIAESAAARTLETLVLSHNPLGDEGVSHLARSPNLGRLKTLELHAVGTGTAGATAIAEGNLAGLRNLKLTDNDIGPEGTRALARSTKLSNLRELALPPSAEDPELLSVFEERFGEDGVSFY